MSITDFVYAVLTFFIALATFFWIAGGILWSRKKARNKRVVLQLMLARVILWLAITVLFLFFKNWICATIFAALFMYTFLKWISNHL